MRRFVKEGSKIVEEVRTDSSQSLTVIPNEDAQALIDSGDAILYDTMDDLYTAITYQRNRRNEYPDVIEQLDQIFHEGIDAWKETIKAVKDAHPKP